MFLQLNKIILTTLFIFCVNSSASTNDVDYAKSLAHQVTQFNNSTIYGEFETLPQANILYQAIPENFNWKDGYTTVFVGFRKAEAPLLNFIQGLSSHIEFVRRALRPMGLRGYVFYITGEYEIAFQNWTSKEEMEQAFKTEAGQTTAKQAGSIMNMGIFEQVIEVDWLNKLQISTKK